jgi:hypothetical protein
MFTKPIDGPVPGLIASGTQAADTRPTERPAEKTGKRRSPWTHEFHKFLQQQVWVSYVVGTEIREVAGVLVAYNGEGHHVVIDTQEFCYFIRLPLEIQRVRKHKGVSHE